MELQEFQELEFIHNPEIGENISIGRYCLLLLIQNFVSRANSVNRRLSQCHFYLSIHSIGSLYLHVQGGAARRGLTFVVSESVISTIVARFPPAKAKGGRQSNISVRNKRNLVLRRAAPPCIIMYGIQLWPKSTVSPLFQLRKEDSMVYV